MRMGTVKAGNNCITGQACTNKAVCVAERLQYIIELLFQLKLMQIYRYPENPLKQHKAQKKTYKASLSLSLKKSYLLFFEDIFNREKNYTVNT